MKNIERIKIKTTIKRIITKRSSQAQMLFLSCTCLLIFDLGIVLPDFAYTMLKGDDIISKKCYVGAASATDSGEGYNIFERTYDFKILDKKKLDKVMNPDLGFKNENQEVKPLSYNELYKKYSTYNMNSELDILKIRDITPQSPGLHVQNNPGKIRGDRFLQERFSKSEVHFSETPTLLSNSLAINPAKCPDFSRKRRGINIEILVEAGYFNPIKVWEPANIEISEIQELRMNHEESQEGINLGIYAKLTGKQVPFTIQAGFSRNIFTEQMNLNYSYIKRDTSQGIISITESEAGDTLSSIYGDIVTLTEVTGNKVRHYRIHLYDLPVTVGYAFSFRKITVGVEAGVVINMRLKSEGSILVSDTSFEEISPQSPFRSNIGLSYLGSVNIGYHLSPRSKIYLNTKLRIIPNSINFGINSLDQRYNLWGVNIAYAYII